jgi:hypoxanthine phosphoribosyltransferase
MTDTIYTFESLRPAVMLLAESLEANHKGYNILTFVKGGVWTSAWLCNFLSWKPQIIALDPKSTPVCSAALTIDFLQQPFVAVDDILDTGKTVKRFEEHKNVAKDFHYYFLVDKLTPDRVFCPDYYKASITTTNPDWVVFPWENL